MQVELQYFDGCPNWMEVDRAIGLLADELGFDLSYRRVETPEEAELMSFRGSPTIVVDGVDPFAAGGDGVGLSCRIYQTPQGPAGKPTPDQLRAVLGA